MKSFQLFIQTLAVVMIITAIPYAFAQYGSSAEVSNKSTFTDRSKDNLPLESHLPLKKNDTEHKVQPPPTKSLLGKWRTSYKTMKVDALYQIKNVGKTVKGYLTAYIDKQGNQYPENLLALTIKNFDGKQGKGTYQMKYEGKLYKVNCTLTLKNTQTLELNYSYQNYPFTETWTRVSK